MTASLLGLVVCLTFVFGPFYEAKSESNSASGVVAGFQGALLDVMKSAKTLSVAQRFERLAPTVDKSFHIGLMTQISAGNFWRTATKDERQKLVGAFRRMSLATLATLFSGYSGETFIVRNEKPGPSKTTIVMTVLKKSDGDEVSIAYVARQFKVGWRMIDVVVDSGISELKVRRSEYHQVLKKGGVPALITLLNNKADQLMSQ